MPSSRNAPAAARRRPRSRPAYRFGSTLDRVECKHGLTQDTCADCMAPPPVPRCRLCNTPLQDELSVALLVGPECVKRDVDNPRLEELLRDLPVHPPGLIPERGLVRRFEVPAPTARQWSSALRGMRRNIQASVRSHDVYTINLWRVDPELAEVRIEVGDTVIYYDQADTQFMVQVEGFTPSRRLAFVRYGDGGPAWRVPTKDLRIECCGNAYGWFDPLPDGKCALCGRPADEHEAA